MNTSPPTFNIERHNQIIEQIEKHPETWHQGLWHCGTAHCYGGWAQVFSGRKVNDRTTKEDAVEWLGLTTHEANIAFSVHNSLKFLKRLPELFTYDQDGYDLLGYNRNDFRTKDGYYKKHPCYSFSRHNYNMADTRENWENIFNNRKP
jgi:hypothetical protein